MVPLDSPDSATLAQQSDANQALAIVKHAKPPVRTAATVAVFFAGTVVGIVGFAVGVGPLACVGAAVVGACIHRLNSAN